MGLTRTAYNLIFRRSSSFMLTMVVGAVVFERWYDFGADAIWENMNKGVRPYIN